VSTILVKGGRVIDPASKTDISADVLLDGGKVVEIGAKLNATGAEMVDASGSWVVPGFIDLHVHLREPGEEYKEDIETGSRAAAAGGFTTIVAMPNTKPVCDNAEVAAFVLARGKQVGLCRVLPAGAVTVGQAGATLAPFGELARAGCVALTDDGHPVQDAGLFRSALEYSRGFSIPILTHAEEKALSKGGFMHEGVVSTRLGLKGIPRLAEDVAVSRDIALAEHAGARLHVCHISTAGAVELVRQAKARGVRVTAEAAPHHFALTHEAVTGYDTFAKMSPPLREESDKDAVIRGLADGTIDAIATDHAPHGSLEKDITFDEAMNGVIGLETALPLVLELVRQKKLTAMRALALLTCGPAAALGLPYGQLRVGGVADVTIIEPELGYTFAAEHVSSKSKNSPFLGKPLTGAAVVTILEGRVVHRRKARA
jgi:dihydroorotase